MHDPNSIPSPPTPAELPRTGRRGLLLGLGAAAGGALIGETAKAESASGGSVTVAPTPKGQAGQGERQSFYGVHQPGIVTPRPAHGMAAAFDVLASSKEDLVRLFKTLTERAAFLMQGGPVPEVNPLFPPPDSGLLGPVVEPDNLTLTVAVGASLFDGRFGLEAAKPRQLARMTRFPNDALEAAQCHGDLMVQICSNSADANIHALRDLIKTMPDLLAIRWKQEGSVPVVAAKDGPPENARNYLGFRDGTANPATNDQALMDELVWVQAGQGEPDWATGGSYQVVRIIRNFVERWDRTALKEQEDIMGRQKMSGAPHGGKSEYDEPVYTDDPKGERTKLDAHIRLANPRTAETRKNLLLRRPFNYSRGVAKNGQLDMGLLFICFQRDLEAGFITVQRRLNGEPLEEYIKPVGGGYFFALPGVLSDKDFLGRSMLEHI
ncbi:deferrochelatase/peroxidase EfeB [Arboricoccus pini]|uniref:Deferrochelatase n=1 Tax=Arboricoccus pini TaxID=1963835 RepID=A0A212RBQ9_9PROT|nr:iron uptake transporter deferrochelatase/peroxidase subunit [Arboricoccus pini]SNB69652.1 deferrochelatase/peroxidase EfeB [Arboricoccus pini]